MYRLLAFLAAVWLSGFPLTGAQAQTAITGFILDQEDQIPLAGVLVTVLHSDQTTRTDEQGEFSLPLQSGTYEVRISLLGYDDRIVELSADATEPVRIALQRSSTTLEEIVLSASAPSFNRSFKGSNHRINPVALRNMNPISTEELLRTVPGVNIVGDMGISNRPNISIRGSWGRRSKKILLLEDGSPAAPAPYIAPGTYYNPVSDRVTAIEVYKGADMLRYGPNNMYGAVNYITALPPQKPSLRVKLAGGQRNYGTGLFSYGGTWNQLGALVEGVYKRFDGFTDNSSVDILNLNAKIFTQLNPRQSLYFKVSGQFEDNQASLSSQTPFTYRTDPTQNPLDADQFTMRRYGLDIIHRWIPTTNLSLTSKVYASDFERDWWRQVTAKVKASEVRDYVGESIFRDRYSYLDGLTPGPEDYVIVGRVQNGIESTTDSRWTFTVSGVKETLIWDWDLAGQTQHFEAGVKFHQEVYKDRFLVADSSRWARSGEFATDLYYHLWSASGYLRQEFQLGRWGLTPIARFEHINMYRQNQLALAQSTTIGSTKEGREQNAYQVLLPGMTIDYQIGQGELYGSVYQGFIAPSKVFGFLVEQNGIVTNPLAGQAINMKPELSINSEIGWRGGLFHNRLDAQATYFNNTIRNFFAGGRNEVFTELGRINMQGLELSLDAQLIQVNEHRLTVNGNATLLWSTILSGRLEDRDLFSQVIHNQATRQEFVAKVNANRDAYEIYVTDSNGGEQLLENKQISMSDFADISRVLVTFGENGVKNAAAPYTPPLSATLGLTYDWQQLSAGVMGHYVGAQYTEFQNFEAESADGAIGHLPAYLTFDAYVNYEIKVGSTRMTVFANGKNLTNQVYRASRLNRATSGVFPGGFRQIIAGVDVRL